MRIGKNFEIDTKEIYLIGMFIVIIIFILSSCASYPNQSKVIKADKTKTATFR